MTEAAIDADAILQTIETAIMEALRRYKAMPVLEIESVCSLEEADVQKALKHLESEGRVVVQHADDADQIVTISPREFDLPPT